MGYGLGEQTPIKINLSRENFNAFIGRHSQPVRWLVSEKCPCIGNNQKVDENCSLCNGKGVIYSSQLTSSRVETFVAPIDGVIEQDNIIWVRDFEGNEYTITSEDCVTYVTGVLRGRSYVVKYTEEITLSGAATAEYVSDKLYKIDLPTQVAFGSVQGDLLTVTSTGLTVTNLFRNFFEISDTIAPGDIEVEYTYIDPFNFALINNNFTKSDQKYLMEVNGTGLMVFPQRWSVYENDVIVALNSTQSKKIIIRSTGVIDTLPSFYLYEMVSAYSIRSNIKYEFMPGTDFIIYKGNQIKWINNPPTEGEQVSFTYLYNTVYKVLSDVPDPRTSENNRFPRKVALRIYTDYNSREGF